jgi:hypothetical protein
MGVIVAAVVWCVWLAMVIGDFGLVWTYGTDLPFSDDFEMVPMLCGQIDDYPAWLWSFCAEHRVPLPRLIQHGIYKLTNNDFRAGMYFNVTALAALSAAMIWTAGRIRGRVSIRDVFFPLAILHWGQWENLLWSWQVQLVSSSVIAGVWLVIVAGSKYPLVLWKAFFAAACVVLLPLCGANGLALVPVLALWLMVAGVWQITIWKRTAIAGGAVMLAGAVGSIGIVYFYFVGFQKTAQTDPSIIAALKTAGEFLTMSFGPAARDYWPAAGWFVAGLTMTGILLLTDAVRQSAGERIRALGLMAFVGGILSLAMGLGWGRSNLGPGQGFAWRYVTLAVPLLCALYFIGGLYYRRTIGRLLQIALFVTSAAALVPNTKEGLEYARKHRQNIAPAESDIANGIPLSLVAQKHTRSFAINDWEQLREEFLRKLKGANIGAFAKMSDDPMVREVRIPIEPISVQNADWDRGVLKATTNDPFLVFALDPPRFVHAIRFRCSYETNGEARGELYWCDTTKKTGFSDAERHITWPEHTHLGERTRTVWINDTIDRFRIDPDNKPGVFTLHEIVLLVPDQSRR